MKKVFQSERTIRLMSTPLVRWTFSVLLDLFLKSFLKPLSQRHQQLLKGSLGTREFIPLYSDVDMNIIVPTFEGTGVYSKVRSLVKFFFRTDFNYLLILPSEASWFCRNNAYFFAGFVAEGEADYFKLRTLELRALFKRFPDYQVSGVRNSRAYPKTIPKNQRKDFHETYFEFFSRLSKDATEMDRRMRAWLGERRLIVRSCTDRMPSNCYHFFDLRNFESFKAAAQTIRPTEGPYFDRSLIVPNQLRPVAYLFAKCYYDVIWIMGEAPEMCLPILYFQQYARHMLEELIGHRSRPIKDRRYEQLIFSEFPYFRLMVVKGIAYQDEVEVREVYSKTFDDPLAQAIIQNKKVELHEFVIKELLAWGD